MWKLIDLYKLLKQNVCFDFQRDVAFRKSFEYLQYYAVGLEQVRIDQVLHSGEFLNDIADMEAKLRQVLCELQISMLSLRVEQNPDITRRVMSTRLRDMNSQTTRDFRDYIIVREYAKGMAYAQQVFGFFIAKLSWADHSAAVSSRFIYLPNQPKTLDGLTLFSLFFLTPNQAFEKLTYLIIDILLFKSCSSFILK